MSPPEADRFPRLKLVQRLGEQAEGLPLRSVDVDHDHRHGPADQFHLQQGRLDGLRQKSAVKAQCIQDVADHRGVQFVANQRERGLSRLETRYLKGF
ncbi:MAG: hypothetical protein U1F77_04155 [Kiritimatiellia bacterium]